MKQKSALSALNRVLVLAGGNSPEKKISLKSGRAVAEALRQAGYEVLFCDPSKQPLAEILRKDFQVIFIALHGLGGEDGALQAKLQKRGLAFVGSEADGCRLSFDKRKTKEALIHAGLPTPDYFVATESNWESKINGQSGSFYVKPYQDGSSLGIIRIERLEKSQAVIRKHIEKYHKLLFEKEVVGREVTVGILNDKALPIVELKPRRKFYDYRAKYTQGLCRYVIPAKLTDAKTRQLQRLALQVHRVLKLKDFSRIDIMLDANLNPYVLEANAIPGFTSMSLLPKAAAQSGVSFEALCSGLVKRAFKRKR